MSITMDDICRQVRQRAMMENSQMISEGNDTTNSELFDMVNSSLAELYDILVLSSSDYFVDGYEFNTVSGQERYDLPVNFYKVMGVDLLDSGDTITIREFNFRERNWHKNSTRFSNSGVPDLYYRILDGSVIFYPAPAAVNKVTLWYIPQMAKLTSSSSLVKNTIVEAWVEYVLCDVTAMVLAKEESDNAYWLMKKQEVKDRITKAAESRNWGESQVIADVYKADSWDFWR